MSVEHRPIRWRSDHRQPARGLDDAFGGDSRACDRLGGVGRLAAARRIGTRDFHLDPVISHGFASGGAPTTACRAAAVTVARAHPGAAASRAADRAFGPSCASGAGGSHSAFGGRGCAGRRRGLRSDRTCPSCIAPRSGGSAAATLHPALAPFGRHGYLVVEPRVDIARYGIGCDRVGGHPLDGGSHRRGCVARVPVANPVRAASGLSSRDHRYGPGTGFGAVDLAGRGRHRPAIFTGHGHARYRPRKNCTPFLDQPLRASPTSGGNPSLNH